MAEVADSIVVKRLVRNLQYKLTYIRVFESFLHPEPHPAVVRLLDALMSAQQTAIVPLSGYLQGLGVAAPGLRLNQRLLDHASGRKTRILAWRKMWGAQSGRAGSFRCYPGVPTRAIATDRMSGLSERAIRGKA